jgi:hypothetical protein
MRVTRLATLVLLWALVAACGGGGGSSSSGGDGQTNAPPPPPPAGAPPSPPPAGGPPSPQSGGSVQLSIPAGRPRLVFDTPEKLAQARAWYQSTGSGQDVWISKAEDAGETAALQAMKSLLSGTSTGCTNAIGWLRNFKLSDLHSSTSDDIRWYGENAMLVIDWCHDALDGMTVVDPDSGSNVKLLAKIERNRDGYLKTFYPKDYGGPSMPMNNYFQGYARTAVLLGIVASGDKDENGQPAIDTQLHLDEGLARRYRDAFIPYTEGAAAAGKGGVPGEGLQYGNYLLDYLSSAWDAASRAGFNLYAQSQFANEATMFLVYNTTPAPTTRKAGTGYDAFPSADDQFFNGELMGTRESVGNFLARTAMRTPGTGVGQYARRLLNMAKPKMVLWTRALDDVSGPERSFDTLPLDYIAPGFGYFYTRNAWGPSATSILIQQKCASGGGGHAHRDQGTFQIWRNGRWVSRETVGYGIEQDPVTGFDDTRRDPSYTGAHNGILFEGLGMADCDETPDGPAKALRLESRDFYSYAAVDLSKAYRDHASDYLSSTHTRELRSDNPHVANVVREFIFVRPLETLIVLDRLKSSAFDRQDVEAARNVTLSPRVTDAAQVRKTFVTHFENAPTFMDDERRVLGVNGNQALEVTTLYPAPANVARRVVNEQSHGFQDGQHRLEITTSGSAQTYFIHALQARDASAPSLLSNLTETADGFVVRLTHPTKGEVVVTLSKGMTSAGGQIGFAATGTATPTRSLVDHVQSMTVSNDGPVWGQ